jgi:hypothetical protein
VPNDAVTVAYVHSDEVAHSWHMSLVEMVGYDWGSQGRIIRGGWLAMRCGTGGVVAGRNKAVERFLAEKDADWLFWIDTDMGFPPDVVDRLMEVTDPNERPIIGGLCFAQRETASDGMGGYRCSPRVTIFDWVMSGGAQGFQGRTHYPVNALVRCAGTGAACVLVHRSAFERIAEEFGPVWYDRVPNPATDGLFGEDLSFCIRANALGLPIYVHTGVKTTHLKHLWLQEADYWAAALPGPATQQTAVIVPVMGRPQNAAPFMASLRASTGLATAYAVVGPEDTAETTQASEAAWLVAGAEVLVGSAVTFAEKVNVAVGKTTEPWVFILGDDVRFHPGWLDHAQSAAQIQGADVVGTNDLGNPRVMAGEHATHLLIRRSYIEQQGASWDGPGVTCHEGYRHWYVDDEIVTVAKQRGAWAMALGSVVEHLHPAWGKADDDDVYRLGQSHAEADRKTFEKRCRIFT